MLRWVWDDGICAQDETVRCAFCTLGSVDCGRRLLGWLVGLLCVGVVFWPAGMNDSPYTISSSRLSFFCF